jgi:hypothetical protein
MLLHNDGLHGVPNASTHPCCSHCHRLLLLVLLVLLLAPDYMLLCVCATTGITRTTREHLAVAVALEIPVAVAVTKCEAVEPEALRQVQQQVQALLDIAAPGPSSRGDCNTDRTDGDTNSTLRPSPAAQLEQAAAAVASAAGAGADKSAGPVQCTTKDEMYTTAAGTAEAVAAGDPVTVSTHQHFGATIITDEAEATRAAVVLSDLRAVTGTARGASFLQASFPVFWVSSVTGQGLQLLHCFLSRLQPATVSSGSAGLTPAGPGGSAAGVAVAQASSMKVATTGQLLDVGSAEALQVGSSQSQAGASNGNSSNGGMAVAGDTLEPDTRTAPILAAAGAAATTGAAGPLADAAPAVLPTAVLTKADEGHFQVAHTFDVEGVGPVVSGIAVAGEGLAV